MMLPAAAIAAKAYRLSNDIVESEECWNELVAGALTRD